MTATDNEIYPTKKSFDTFIPEPVFYIKLYVQGERYTGEAARKLNYFYYKQ